MVLLRVANSLDNRNLIIFKFRELRLGKGTIRQQGSHELTVRSSLQVSAVFFMGNRKIVHQKDALGVFFPRPWGRTSFYPKASPAPWVAFHNPPCSRGAVGDPLAWHAAVPLGPTPPRRPLHLLRHMMKNLLCSVVRSLFNFPFGLFSQDGSIFGCLDFSFGVQ